MEHQQADATVSQIAAAAEIVAAIKMLRTARRKLASDQVGAWGEMYYAIEDRPISQIEEIALAALFAWPSTLSKFE
jgi:hypothetical protein